MNPLYIISFILFALVLFFLARGVYLSLRLQKVTEEQKKDFNLEKNLLRKVFGIYKLYLGVIFFEKNPLIREARNKWFINWFLFFVTIIVTAFFNARFLNIN